MTDTEFVPIAELEVEMTVGELCADLAAQSADDALEQRLWSVIDRDGLADVPSDIVAAVALLNRRASACAPGADDAELAAIRERCERDSAALSADEGTWEWRMNEDSKALLALIDRQSAEIERLRADRDKAARQAEDQWAGWIKEEAARKRAERERDEARAEVASAYRKGQEDMRERAAHVSEPVSLVAARFVRALEIEESPDAE